MMQIETPIPRPEMLCDEDEDLNGLCRLCAHSSELLVPIYEGEGLKAQLADKIASYLPIQVRQTDSLPIHLCYQCASLVLSWHELVTGCVQAEHHLRKIFKSQINGGNKNNVSGKYKEQAMSVETNVNVVEEDRPGPAVHHREMSQAPPENNAAKPMEPDNGNPHKAPMEPGRYVIQKTQKTFNNLAEDLSMAAAAALASPQQLVSTKYPCQQCGRPFSRRYDMQRHVRAVHRTGANDGEASCDICGKSFSRANDAKRHRERVHPVNEAGMPLKPEKNHVCTVCNSAFTRKNDLKRHLLKTHAIVMNEPELKQHYRMMQVDGTRAKKEEDVERLRKAAVVVDGRTCYQCDVCSKSLHQPYLFLRHYRIHTGELPFTCDICSKSFRLSASLIRHKKDVHLRKKGEQPVPQVAHSHPGGGEHKNIWDICWEGLHSVPGLYYH